MEYVVSFVPSHGIGSKTITVYTGFCGIRYDGGMIFIGEHYAVRADIVLEIEGRSIDENA